MILIIANQELRFLFRSPLAWLILGIMQIVFAWLFLSALEHYLTIQPKLALNMDATGSTAYIISQYFAPAAIIMLLISPLISMKCLSEESRSGTIILLRSAPVGAGSIVLGKFLGVLAFQILLLSLVFIMPLSLIFFTKIDVASLATAVLGLTFFSAACTAISLYFSSLSTQPIIAAFSAFASLLFLWMLGTGSYSNELLSSILFNLSLPVHLNSFLRGLIDTRDIVYFALVVALFLSFTILRFDAQRFMESR